MSNDRLHVDWIRCQGRGLCHELLPEILAADDWGYPVSRTVTPNPRSPAGCAAMPIARSPTARASR